MVKWKERKMVEQDAQEPSGKLGRKWPSKMLKNQVEGLVELMVLWNVVMIKVAFVIRCPWMCYENCVWKNSVMCVC